LNTEIAVGIPIHQMFIMQAAECWGTREKIGGKGNLVL
jgi:hypothetical protein